MPRGVRVLTVGAIGALLVGLTGAVFEARAEIRTLQLQAVSLRTAAASPARMAVEVDSSEMVGAACAEFTNRSARKLDLTVRIVGSAKPDAWHLNPGESTDWCMDTIQH